MQYIGAIFDLDGVVVDTAKYHYLSWKRLANDLGLAFTEHDNERLKGVSRLKSLEILLEINGININEKCKQELTERKNDWYLEHLRQLGPGDVLPGVINLLKILRRAGIRIGLASASCNAGIILDQLKIRDLFDCIIDGTKVAKTKPDPEVFLKTAEGLGLPPEVCVIFEDAVAGIEAAHRAGMIAIGVGRAEDLSEADLIVSGVWEFHPKVLFGVE